MTGRRTRASLEVQYHFVNGNDIMPPEVMVDEPSLAKNHGGGLANHIADKLSDFLLELMRSAGGNLLCS